MWALLLKSKAMTMEINDNHNAKSRINNTIVDRSAQYDHLM